MNINDLFEAEFGPEAAQILQRAISWIPEVLQPISDISQVDRETLFSEFVQYKQKLISEALHSMFKVSHTSKSVSAATVEGCVTATTKGTAKIDNERWFLELLFRSRLSFTLMQNRINYLIDTYCVPSMALPADMTPIKAACEASLRQRRIDFKQKLKKLYRKILADKLPDSLDTFKQQIIVCIGSPSGEDGSSDQETVYSKIPMGTVRYFKDVLLDSLEHTRDAPILSFLNGIDDGDSDFQANDEAAEATGEINGDTSTSDSQARNPKKRAHDEVSVVSEDEEEDNTRKRTHGGTR